MSISGIFDKDSWFEIYGQTTGNISSRIATILMNCDIPKLQTLFELNILRPGDIGYDYFNGECNLVNILLFREILKGTTKVDEKSDLVDVSEQQVKDTIQFLVEHGIDINFHQDGGVEYPIQLKSYCSPVEVALYLGEFDLVDFLLSLGATPPRELPILRSGFQQKALFDVRKNLPRNIKHTLGPFLGGAKKLSSRKSRKLNRK